LDNDITLKKTAPNKLLLGIGCILPLVVLIWLLIFLMTHQSNNPRSYQATTPSQKFDWGELYVSIRIPYSADFPREELADSYETGVIIEVRPNSTTVEQNCLFKPMSMRISETDFDKLLVNQTDLWDPKRGEGSRLRNSSNNLNQVHLSYLKFDISPDDKSFNMRFAYEIICGEERSTHLFEKNFRRTYSTANFHIR